MAEVKLILQADNTQYVNKIKEAQTATQKLHDTAEGGMKRQGNLFDNLSKHLDNLKEKNRKAFTTAEMDAYEKQIKKTNDALNQLNTAQKETTDEGTSLKGMMKDLALSFGGAAAILGALKKAFVETTGGMKLFNQIGAVTKQVLNDITSGAGLSIERMGRAAQAAGKLADIRMQDLQESLRNKDLMKEYNELYTKGIDQTITATEKIKYLTEAKKKFEEATKNEIRSSRESLKILMDIWKLEPTNIEAMQNVYAMANKIKDLQTGLASGTRRIVGQITGEQEAENKKQMDALAKIHEYGKKLTDAFNADELAAFEKKTKEQEKIIQEFFADWEREAQIDINKRAEMMKSESGMGSDIDNWFDQAMKGAGLDNDKRSKRLLETKDFIDNYFKEWEQQTEIDNKKHEDADKEAIDNQKKKVEALKQIFSEFLSISSSIADQAFQDAQRHREILDTQVSEAQSALETETELYKAGYASNVGARKKQVADLQILRNAALKNEEEAARKQKVIDTISQVSSLITASAQTFKAFPGPLLPIAIAVVTAMFAAFAASKISASKATKLAMGGSGSDTGIVTGRSHAQGGERFLNHVEVERGEAWGVLNIPATQKFGKVFHHMVSSFNKGEIPTIVSPVNKINNRVMVENSGPNSRLDQVITEQRKLNAKLSSDSIQDLGSTVVIRKGNTTRIIRK